MPDENLTMEQKKKRHEKLGFLKSLNSQLQLFPEDGMGGGGGPPGGPMTSQAGNYFMPHVKTTKNEQSFILNICGFSRMDICQPQTQLKN